MLLTIEFSPDRNFSIDAENYDDIRSMAIAEFWIAERPHTYMEAFYWLDSNGKRCYIINEEQFCQRDRSINELYFTFIHENWISNYTDYPDNVIATIYWKEACTKCGMKPLIGDCTLGTAEPPNKFMCELCSKPSLSLELNNTDTSSEEDLEGFDETIAGIFPNLPIIVEVTDYLKQRRQIYEQNFNPETHLNLSDDAKTSLNAMMEIDNNTEPPTGEKLEYMEL